MKESEPPVCGPHGGRGVGAPRGNQNRRTHGFYRQRRDLDDEDVLDPEARDLSLQPEIYLMRVVVRRLKGADGEALPATVKADLYGCVMDGLGTIGRLYLTEQKVKGSAKEVAAGAGEFNLRDEIALTRIIIRDAMGYWREREPEVKEMIQLARGVNRGVNRVRRLVEAQLELMDDTGSEVIEAIIQAAMEIEGRDREER
jgi:hypothetical protein